MDNYTLFCFKFLKDNVSSNSFRKELFSTPKVHSWCGNAFERVCLEHIVQIKAALGIAGVHTEVNSWQCRRDEEKGIFGSQIDLLIVRKDQIINRCEMKYCETDYPVDAAFDMDMKRKISDLVKKTGTKYAIHPTLITAYGVEPNSHSADIRAVITADDLFMECGLPPAYRALSPLTQLKAF
ncbi:MAG: hypothetical protein ACI4NM_06250 [Bullifex sp.]